MKTGETSLSVHRTIRARLSCCCLRWSVRLAAGRRWSRTGSCARQARQARRAPLGRRRRDRRPLPDRRLRGRRRRGRLLPAPPAGSAPSRSGCDLTGRWLVAQRVLATAIGQQQAAHTWFYYEIRPAGRRAGGDARGLHCGFDVVKKTALAATVDSSARLAGAARSATAAPAGAAASCRRATGCRLQLDREYVVRGATRAPTTPTPPASCPTAPSRRGGASPAGRTGTATATRASA